MGLNPLLHYLRGDVLREIAEWLKDRWVALEGVENGRRVFVRYSFGKKPLTVASPNDLRSIILKYRNVVRTIYGSLNKYRKLSSELDTEVLPNIYATTPTWDVDASYERWRYAIEAAKIIIDELLKHRVEKSVYLVWSGKGVHIHIHEEALSPEMRSRIHPFDAAYAIVEYILRRVRPKLLDLVKQSNGVLKIENLVDIKRVFTAPLSLHRELDVVAICFSVDDLDSFDISWTNPENYRHKPVWRQYIVGELDELASIAVKEVGLRSLQEGLVHVKRTSISLSDILSQQEEEVRVGRFEVMALLQAVRYYLLTGDLEKAKSFGLNRAIFYAWAKYYGPHGRRRTYVKKQNTEALSSTNGKKFIDFFGEKVPISSRGWFIMGDQEQLPEDFDRHIKSKLEIIAPWEEIWQAAIEYVKRFPQHILKDPQKFYEYVYLPVRDSFVEKVLKRGRKETKGLLAFVLKNEEK